MKKNDYKVMSYYFGENLIGSRELLIDKLGKELVEEGKIKKINDVSNYGGKLIEQYIEEINSYTKEEFNEFIKELIQYNKNKFGKYMYHTVFYNTFRYLIIVNGLDKKFTSEELNKTLNLFCKDVYKNCKREDYKGSILTTMYSYCGFYINTITDIKRYFLK